MLNNSDPTVREMARASLIQPLGKRKFPFAKDNDKQFLGFKVKSNGKLDNRAAGFGVRSDWLDLNDLCHRNGLRLEWARTDSATIGSRDIIADPLIYPRATYELSDERRELPLTTARAVILSMKRAQSAQHWKGLRLQGKLACLSFADQSLSHTIYSNVSIARIFSSLPSEPASKYSRQNLSCPLGIPPATNHTAFSILPPMTIAYNCNCKQQRYTNTLQLKWTGSIVRKITVQL